MRQRAWAGATALLLLATAGSVPAEAKYRYSRYSGAGAGEEQGFFLFIEGALTNPRNTDGVVAVVETREDFGGGVNRQRPVLPVWDDEVAGRLGFGYAWGNGNRLQGSFWGYSGDQSAFGDGPGLTHFTVGPPIPTMSGYVGNQGNPGHYAITNEIEATTGDISWGRANEIGESFTMDWSVGVRYARYEETSSGFYDEAGAGDAAYGQLRYDVYKNGVGEMFGVRGAVRGTYMMTDAFSVSAGLGVSFLDGEISGDAETVPSGTVNSTTVGSAVASVFDDGRSGQIRDLDVVVGWQSASDRYRIWFGWEQAIWDDIASDLLRNLPGSTAQLHERNSVTFSGYKLGIRFRF